MRISIFDRLLPRGSRRRRLAAQIVPVAPALACALTATSPALAESTVDSTAAERVGLALTVYNSDLALIRDQRRIDLPKGGSEVRFGDVTELIRPDTVSVVVGEGEPVRLLEQNYEYDLLSPDKVLEKYVGRDVTVYVKNEKTGNERPVKATLLSTNQGRVFRIGGDISLGLPGRVVVEEIPENLIARPTLLWRIEAARRGSRDLDVTYLTRGMGWRADYVAALSSDEKTLDLTGWVTLDNRSGATFEDATLKLVAGDVNQVRAPAPVRGRAVMAAMAESQDSFQQREFFEYHLYALERPTTLKQNQSKQIELLSAADVPVVKRYLAESHFQPYAARVREAQRRKVDVKLELTNDAESNLGRPLPKGVVRVYKQDVDDSKLFAGEDSIDHTPVDEEVRLTLGQAFDVSWERTLTSFLEVNKREVEAAISVVVKNRKSEPVTVTVVERFAGERKLLGSSMKVREPDAFTLEFDVDVAAGGESTIRYEVRAKR